MLHNSCTASAAWRLQRGKHNHGKTVPYTNPTGDIGVIDVEAKPREVPLDNFPVQLEKSWSPSKQLQTFWAC
jgi:hypothetical protein